jgi:hypothetical protein
MHPVIIYKLVQTRMEQDGQAARSRITQAEMPRVPRSSAGGGRQITATKRWQHRVLPLQPRSRALRALHPGYPAGNRATATPPPIP